MSTSKQYVKVYFYERLIKQSKRLKLLKMPQLPVLNMTRSCHIKNGTVSSTR